jgi:hypothetical protein
MFYAPWHELERNGTALFHQKQFKPANRLRFAVLKKTSEAGHSLRVVDWCQTNR